MGEHETKTEINGNRFTLVNLHAAHAKGAGRAKSTDGEKGENIEQLPFSIRVLLENVLRNYDEKFFEAQHIESLRDRNHRQGQVEIPFLPSRMLMQDFT